MQEKRRRVGHESEYFENRRGNFQSSFRPPSPAVIGSLRQLQAPTQLSNERYLETAPCVQGKAAREMLVLRPPRNPAASTASGLARPESKCWSKG